MRAYSGRIGGLKNYPWGSRARPQYLNILRTTFLFSFETKQNIEAVREDVKRKVDFSKKKFGA